MVNLELLDAAPEELDMLSQLIQDGFHIVDTVEAIFRVTEGACNARHMVARVTSGDIYGIKSSIRLPHALDKEKLVGDLAVLLKAPNASQIIQIPDFTLGVFGNDRVNITRWLADAEKIRSIPPDELKKNPDVFLQQYGQWMLFGLCFGVADRHTGNWVWNADAKKLLMIDTQDSFNQSGLHISNFKSCIELVSQEPGRLISDPFSCEDGKHLVDGLEEMRAKLDKRKEQVRQLVDTYEFARNFQSRYLAAPVRLILEELASA